jgi:hypothetical protein
MLDIHAASHISPLAIDIPATHASQAWLGREDLSEQGWVTRLKLTAPVSSACRL